MSQGRGVHTEQFARSQHVLRVITRYARAVCCLVASRGLLLPRGVSRVGDVRACAGSIRRSLKQLLTSAVTQAQCSHTCQEAECDAQIS